MSTRPELYSRRLKNADLICGSKGEGLLNRLKRLLFQ